MLPHKSIQSRTTQLTPYLSERPTEMPLSEQFSDRLVVGKDMFARCLLLSDSLSHPILTGSRLCLPLTTTRRSFSWCLKSDPRIRLRCGSLHLRGNVACNKPVLIPHSVRRSRIRPNWSLVLLGIAPKSTRSSRACIRWFSWTLPSLRRRRFYWTMPSLRRRRFAWPMRCRSWGWWRPWSTATSSDPFP